MHDHRVQIVVELAQASVLLERGEAGATSVTVQPPEYALDEPVVRLIEWARALMDAGDMDAALGVCRGIGRVRRTDWRTQSRLPRAVARWEPAIAAVVEEIPGPSVQARRGDPA